MLKLIVQKELREIVLSTKFAFAFAVFSVLILLAFYLGAESYLNANENYHAALYEDARLLDGVDDWNDVSTVRVRIPPEPLASLITGVTNDMSDVVFVGAFGRPDTFAGLYSREPVFAIFRFLDLEFIFTVVLSLFAVLFAYDAVNGEKERGTLRLSFANSVPRARYILGKFCGIFLAMSTSLLVPILVGIGLLIVMGVVLSLDEWMRLGLFIVTGMLYLAVFVTLSLMVSVLTKRSSSALFLLLMLWVFFVLVLPKVSALAAGNLVDVPESSQITYQLNELRKDIYARLPQASRDFKPDVPPPADDSDPEVLKEHREKVMAQYNEFYRRFSEEGDAEMKSVEDRLYEERDNRLRQQEQLAFNLARISPAAAFSLAGRQVANTSLDLQRDFLRQANRYRAQFLAFKEAKTGIKQSSVQISTRIASQQQRSELIDPSEMPRLEYQSMGFRNALAVTLPDLLLLTIYALIFFLAAFIAFLRYDLR